MKNQPDDLSSNKPEHIDILPANVTIRDIARICNVSKTTVSVALYGTKPIKESTRRRIIETAQSMGYDTTVPNIARRLALRKSPQRVINHVISYFTQLDFTQGAYSRDFYRGLAVVCRNKQYAVLLTEIYPYLNREEMIETLPGIFARGDVDGVIMGGESKLLSGILREMPGFGTRPIVWFLHPETGTSCVISNDDRGTYDAMRHLLQLGHRHILHLYDPLERTIVIRRVTGIQTAMREAGINPDTHLSNIIMPTNLLNPSFAPHVLPIEDSPAQEVTLGADILLPYLREHPEITAIFCENDAMALNIWHMLHNAGLNVPNDISLIGFDDTDGMLDSTGTNHLTTIRLPLYEMGVKAAELLIQRITGELTEDVVCNLPVEFIIRQSTAPARTR
jgi:LacI family transcriptional regulator